jgi:hypothetical protein
MSIDQVSWLTFILLTAPSHHALGMTVTILRLSSRSQSRGGGRLALPSLKSMHWPNSFCSASGMKPSIFRQKKSLELASQGLHPDLITLYSSWQNGISRTAFQSRASGWCSGSGSSYSPPLPGFPVAHGGFRPRYSGGTAPDFNGIPF